MRNWICSKGSKEVVKTVGILFQWRALWVIMRRSSIKEAWLEDCGDIKTHCQGNFFSPGTKTALKFFYFPLVPSNIPLPNVLMWNDSLSMKQKESKGEKRYFTLSKEWSSTGLLERFPLSDMLYIVKLRHILKLMEQRIFYDLKHCSRN